MLFQHYFFLYHSPKGFPLSESIQWSCFIFQIILNYICKNRKFKTMRYLTLVFIFVLITFESNGQIFDRIINRTQDKLEREISNRIVERISDEIARAAMKPIDQAIDDMLRERYEQDSISGNTSSRNYGDFLAAFTVPVDLPASYNFDMVLEAEAKDYDGEKSKLDMMLTKDGSAIGIVQYDEDKKSGMMVFDMDNSVMAIYTEDNDGKKVTALPSMLSLAGAMDSAEKGDEDTYEVTIKKTGKTKKILGYQTEEWETDEEATTTKSYVAEDFPISWKDSFSRFIKELMPTTRREEMPDGMVLKSETKTKKKNKKSSFEVKKIIDEPYIINNGEYEQASYEAEEE